MRAILDRLYLISGVLGAAFLLAILVIVLLQVGARLLDTAVHAVTGTYQGFVIPSYADFAGFFLVAGTFLALAYTFRHGAHIRVSLLLQAMSPALKRAADLLSAAIALSLSGFLAWYCWELVYESWSFGDTSSGLVSIPLYIPQSAMALGATLFAISIADTFITLLRGQEDIATAIAGRGEEN